jgi:molybdenum cofactor cytidylyltransferase
MISGIILASGFSSRMRQNKLLLPIEGLPLVERVVRAASLSFLDEAILVFRDVPVQEIGEKYGLRTVYNESAKTGQSAAVNLGVREASEEVSGYLFLVGDQPYMNEKIINRMLDAHLEQPNRILAAAYRGGRGNPVLFPVSFREHLLNLISDTGGRQIIKQFPDKVTEVVFDDESAGIDVDTPEEYKRLFLKE